MVILYQLIAIVIVIALFAKIWKMKNDVAVINGKANASFSILQAS